MTATQIRLPSGQLVYDPRGTITAETKPLASRVAQLDGLRLGILDNTKWNAGKLLRHIVTELEQQISFATIQTYQKESFSRSATQALITQIATESDVVITAIGD